MNGLAQNAVRCIRSLARPALMQSRCATSSADKPALAKNKGKLLEIGKFALYLVAPVGIVAYFLHPLVFEKEMTEVNIGRFSEFLAPVYNNSFSESLRSLSPGRKGKSRRGGTQTSYG